MSDTNLVIVRFNVTGVQIRSIERTVHSSPNDTGTDSETRKIETRKRDDFRSLFLLPVLASFYMKPVEKIIDH